MDQRPSRTWMGFLFLLLASTETFRCVCPNDIERHLKGLIWVPVIASKVNPEKVKIFF